MPSDLYKKIFEEKWPSELGAVILALLNTLMFLYSGPIATTTAVIADWGRWVYKIPSMNIQPPAQFLQASRYYAEHVLYIGLMSGVFLSALTAKQFSLKREKISGYVQGFIGGSLMGIGSFLAGACILGGLYSDIMGLSLSGFVMMAGLLAGAFIGGKFVIWQINRESEKLFGSGPLRMGNASKNEVIKKDYRRFQPAIAAVASLVILFIIAADIYKGSKFPAAAFLFGAFFGVVFQRSAFCFASAFREIFVTRTTRMMRSLVISLLIGVAGFTLVKTAGLRPEESYVFRAGWNIFFGSVIFGFGMTITGG
ncbi:MAG: YeeE/YedE family protein [Nitrospirae bacterium]|nr:YeeE/YedE family protein [Nitrospirota bacterium]